MRSIWNNRRKNKPPAGGLFFYLYVADVDARDGYAVTILLEKLGLYARYRFICGDHEAVIAFAVHQLKVTGKYGLLTVKEINGRNAVHELINIRQVGNFTGTDILAPKDLYTLIRAVLIIDVVVSETEHIVIQKVAAAEISVGDREIGCVKDVNVRSLQI